MRCEGGGKREMREGGKTGEIYCGSGVLGKVNLRKCLALSSQITEPSVEARGSGMSEII